MKKKMFDFEKKKILDIGKLEKIMLKIIQNMIFFFML